MSNSNNGGKIAIFIVILIILGGYLIFRQMTGVQTVEKQSNDLKRGNATQKSIEQQLKKIQTDQQQKVDAATPQSDNQDQK